MNHDYTNRFLVPCGDGGIDDENLNKRHSIVNKVFVEMLEKLGYDIQITYVKKETD